MFVFRGEKFAVWMPWRKCGKYQNRCAERETERNGGIKKKNTTKEGNWKLPPDRWRHLSTSFKSFLFWFFSKLGHLTTRKSLQQTRWIAADDRNFFSLSKLKTKFCTKTRTCFTVEVNLLKIIFVRKISKYARPTKIQCKFSMSFFF